jgi:hypothetical protein
MKTRELDPKSKRGEHPNQNDIRYSAYARKSRKLQGNTGARFIFSRRLKSPWGARFAPAASQCEAAARESALALRA